MNRGITKENLLFILPPALSKDKSVMALAEVDAEALAARPAEIEKARVIANIDGLDEAVLDILAHDFKVDWWDANYSIEEKRQTLKDSWRAHRILGTKAAVETAISAIYPGTKVQEWWEYGGEPFYFRLFLNAGELRPDTEKHRKVLERVYYYKSLRSHLDGFIWNFAGKPFLETSGRLIFHRFILSLAFSERRSIPPLRLDGSWPLDGSALLNTVPSAMFGFPCLRVRGSMEQNKQSVSRAALTVDTMYTLDGSVLLDGSRKLNADIRQEDL